MRRQFHQVGPLGCGLAILGLSCSLLTPASAVADPLGPTGFAPVVAGSALAPASVVQAAPTVVATYYFALFLAGPTGCMHFMSDGTIVGPDARFHGTYFGLPWLALFETDGEFRGLTSGLVLWMIRPDGIWGLGLLFNVWGVSCEPPA